MRHVSTSNLQRSRDELLESVSPPEVVGDGIDVIIGIAERFLLHDWCPVVWLRVPGA